MIKLEELENGNLKIVVTDVEQFKEEIDKFKNIQQCQLTEDLMLESLLDSSRYLGNNWYCNQIIGLTEAPNICKGALYADKDANKINDYLELIKEGIYDIGIDFEPKSFRNYLEQNCNIEPELPIDFEKIWYYPNYMTQSCIMELENNGFVIFERVI